MATKEKTFGTVSGFTVPEIFEEAHVSAGGSQESKALRLARYLKEFVGLRSTTVRDVDKYETVLWFADMPQEADCTSSAWDDTFESGAPWLEVRKQRFPKPPEPPEVVLPWIDQQALKEGHAETPQLRPSILFAGSGCRNCTKARNPNWLKQRSESTRRSLGAYDHYQAHLGGLVGRISPPRTHSSDLRRAFPHAHSSAQAGRDR